MGITIDNKQDIVIAWTVAILVHVLFFSLTGKMFIKPPQFAIAPIREIDINLIDAPKEIDQVQVQPKPVIKQVEKIIPKEVKSVIARSVATKQSLNSKKIAASPPAALRNASRKDTNRALNEGRIDRHSQLLAIGPLAKPDYIQNPPPPYPDLAKQMHQEGIVMLSVDVDKEGDPVSVEIIQSSGFHMLDQAALNAVRHWKFSPGTIGNIPVASTVTVPIRFRLQE